MRRPVVDHKAQIRSTRVKSETIDHIDSGRRCPRQDALVGRRCAFNPDVDSHLARRHPRIRQILVARSRQVQVRTDKSWWQIGCLEIRCSTAKQRPWRRAGRQIGCEITVDRPPPYERWIHELDNRRARRFHWHNKERLVGTVRRDHGVQTHQPQRIRS